MSLWFLLCLFALGMFITQLASSACISMENDADHSHTDLNPLYPLTVTFAWIGITVSVTSIVSIVRRVEGLTKNKKRKDKINLLESVEQIMKAGEKGSRRIRKVLKKMGR